MKREKSKLKSFGLEGSQLDLIKGIYIHNNFPRVPQLNMY